MRIDVLPDDVLLEIFYLYVNMDTFGPNVDAWKPLVRICRRWRSLVFESPRRLDLRLYCTPKTPARENLDVWPSLPLVVRGNMAYPTGMDNIIAALRQSNRVRQVFLLSLMGWQLEEILVAMQVSFPEMTTLMLSSDDETPPIIPDSFLDHWSAPRLQYFELSGILFPRMRTLLLSASHLATLYLSGIPHSGYISPEAMVALLSALSSLDILTLAFQSHQSRPDRKSRILPPPKRSVLSVYKIRFKGVTEYLEELVSRIHAPRLKKFHIVFFNQIDFDCPQLAQFINCTPTLRPFEGSEVHLQFDDRYALVRLPPFPKSNSRVFEIAVACKALDWQLSSIDQVCNSGLHRLSTAVDLYIEHKYWHLFWENDAIESTLWLRLLLPFTAVKNLYLPEEFAPGIASALQGLVGTRTTEVLPNLQNIFVKKLIRLTPPGPYKENIEQFVAARQLSGHPITISVWE